MGENFIFGTPKFCNYTASDLVYVLIIIQASHVRVRHFIRRMDTTPQGPQPEYFLRGRQVFKYKFTKFQLN